MNANGTPRVANLLGALGLAVTDRTLAAIGEAGTIGVSGAAALVRLSEEPGIGVSELGRRLRISQPQAGRVADRLVSQGLVQRTSGPDGRSISLAVTEKGRTVTNRVLQARQAVLVALIDSLDAAQRDQLEHTLEVLLDGIYDQIRSATYICRLCEMPSCLTNDASCPVSQAARAQGHEDTPSHRRPER